MKPSDLHETLKMAATVAGMLHAGFEAQCEKIEHMEAVLADIHATSRRVTHHHEWYIDGVRQSPGVYVVMRVGDAPDAPETPF